MTTRPIRRGRWLRAVTVGVSLSLLASQVATADSLRPTVDSGGPGGETSSTEVYYELLHEQGRPVVIEQADSESAELADYQRSQVWPNFELADSVAPGLNTSMLEGGPYAIVDNQGNESVPEQATSQTDPSAAARRAMAANENLRSILMIEGKEVANSDAVPAFAIHPNLRSIQIIEGNQAVAELAQPASLSAYAICLACSSLG